MKYKTLGVYLMIVFFTAGSLFLQSCTRVSSISEEQTIDVFKGNGKLAGKTLIQKTDGSEASAKGSGEEIKSIDTKKVDAPINTDTKTTIATKEELRPILISNLQEGKDTVFKASDDLIKQGIDKMAINLAETSGFGGYIINVEYSMRLNKVSLHFNYRDGKESFLSKFAKVDSTVKKIVSSVVKPGMSDFQKELALHDYIVNNTDYDNSDTQAGSIPDDDFTAYGVFVNRKAVCEGYAEVMYRLLNAAGIENYIVIGTGGANPHAWNIVSIGGKYYHLDSTFDDPVSESGNVLSYDYFNLDDSQMSWDHTWTKSDYPACTSTVANYYVKTGKYADNVDEFYDIVKKGLEQKAPAIMVKTSVNDTNTFKKDIVYQVVKDDKKLSYVDLSKGYHYSYSPDNCVYEFYITYK
ncbi:MAG: transglutaminase domain-containing protein [Bacillota bacterium]|nr:transglutaminase domain-containing protein [Bacillota bacterium]